MPFWSKGWYFISDDLSLSCFSPFPLSGPLFTDISYHYTGSSLFSLAIIFSNLVFTFFLCISQNNLVNSFLVNNLIFQWYLNYFFWCIIFDIIVWTQCVSFALKSFKTLFYNIISSHFWGLVLPNSVLLSSSVIQNVHRQFLEHVSIQHRPFIHSRIHSCLCPLSLVCCWCLLPCVCHTMPLFHSRLFSATLYTSI